MIHYEHFFLYDVKVKFNPYHIDGDHFLPLLLIQDAGIVAYDVYPSECVYCALKGSWKVEMNSFLFLYLH